MRRPAIATHEVFQFFMADAGQQSRIVNLVAVQVEDGQNRSIPNWTEELVDVPRGCQWSCLRFTVSNYGCDDQLGIVERSAASVGKHVAQLAAFVNRTRSLRRAVTADAAGERKLLEE